MRDTAIQVIRVASMLFIVFYHCLCYYGVWHIQDVIVYDNIESWRAACNFALTAFVFISGLLYAKLYSLKEKYRNRPKLFKDKLKRLLVPYCFWSIFGLMLFPSEHALMNFLSGAQHLWFLLMLLTIFFVVISIGRNILNIRLLIGGGILFILLNAILAKYGSAVPNLGAWQTAVRYMPAFLCGILVWQLDLTTKLMKWPRWILYTTFVISLACVVFFGINRSLPLGLLYMSIPTFILLTCLYAALTIRPVKPDARLLTNLDRNSMGIYIIHHLLIWAALLYIPWVVPLMNRHHILAPIALFVAVFSASWLIAEWMQRTKITRYILGSK